MRLPARAWPWIVAALAGVVYLNTLGNGFALDDVSLVRDNPHLRSASEIPRLWLEPYWPEAQGGAAAGLYRPVTIVSLALNRLLLGAAPAGYHAVNLVLHALVSALFLLAARRVGGHPAVAPLAALIFAVHPLHTEAVAGIAGRAELLAALFVLAGWLAHRRAVRATGATAVVPWALAAAVAYLLATLSKESAILAPALWFLDDQLRRPPREAAVPWSRRVTVHAFQVAGLAASLAMRVAALGGIGRAETMIYLDNPPAFAGAAARVATALWVQVRYVALFCWPANLSSDYSHAAIPIVRSAADPRLWAGVAWVVVLAALAFAGWRRSRPVLLSAAIWVLFFLPSSNLLFASGTVMAERLAYLPSAGACLLAALGGVRLAAGTPVHRPARAATGAVVALVVLAALAGRTLVRNPDWRSNLALAVHDVAVNPRSAKLHGGAGIALADAGETARAEHEFRRAIEIWPDYAQMHYNLGSLLAARGERAEAIEHLREAARIAPGNPGPYRLLAPLLESAGRMNEALAVYEAGCQLDPGDVSFRFNYGRALLASGRVGEAREVLDRLAAADPRGLTGALARALVREVSGDAAGAARIYRALLDGGRLPPDLRQRVEVRLGALERQAAPGGGSGR